MYGRFVRFKHTKYIIRDIDGRYLKEFIADIFASGNFGCKAPNRIALMHRFLQSSEKCSFAWKVLQIV